MFCQLESWLTSQRIRWQASLLLILSISICIATAQQLQGAPPSRHVDVHLDAGWNVTDIWAEAQAFQEQLGRNEGVVFAQELFQAACPLPSTSRPVDDLRESKIASFGPDVALSSLAQLDTLLWGETSASTLSSPLGSLSDQRQWDAVQAASAHATSGSSALNNMLRLAIDFSVHSPRVAALSSLLLRDISVHALLQASPEADVPVPTRHIKDVPRLLSCPILISYNDDLTCGFSSSLLSLLSTTTPPPPPQTSTISVAEELIQLRRIDWEHVHGTPLIPNPPSTPISVSTPPLVVLYADFPSSPCAVATAYSSLLSASQQGLIRFILRPKLPLLLKSPLPSSDSSLTSWLSASSPSGSDLLVPPSAVTTWSRPGSSTGSRRLAVQGWGAELALKSTEYKVVNEASSSQSLSSSSTSSSSSSSPSEDTPTIELEGVLLNRLAERYPSLADPLKTTVASSLSTSTASRIVRDSSEKFPAYRMGHLGVQLAQSILRSDDPLAELVALTADFPHRAPLLIDTLPSPSINDSLSKNIAFLQKQATDALGLSQAQGGMMMMGMPRVSDIATQLYVNGAPLSIPYASPIDLSNLFLREAALTSSLSTIPIPTANPLSSSSSSPSSSSSQPNTLASSNRTLLNELISMPPSPSTAPPTVRTAAGMVPGWRVDYLGHVESTDKHNQTSSLSSSLSSVVTWMNDIESDPRYKPWSPSLEEAFGQPGWPNQLRYVRRNVHEALLVVDLSRPLAIQLVYMANQFITGNAPARIGILAYADRPKYALSSSSSTASSVIHADVSVTGSTTMSTPSSSRPRVSSDDATALPDTLLDSLISSSSSSDDAGVPTASSTSLSTDPFASSSSSSGTSATSLSLSQKALNAFCILRVLGGNRASIDFILSLAMESRVNGPVPASTIHNAQITLRDVQVAFKQAFNTIPSSSRKDITFESAWRQVITSPSTTLDDSPITSQWVQLANDMRTVLEASGINLPTTSRDEDTGKSRPLPEGEEPTKTLPALLLHGVRHAYLPGMHYRDLLMSAVIPSQQPFVVAAHKGILRDDSNVRSFIRETFKDHMLPRLSPRVTKPIADTVLAPFPPSSYSSLSSLDWLHTQSVSVAQLSLFAIVNLNDIHGIRTALTTVRLASGASPSSSSPPTRATILPVIGSSTKWSDLHPLARVVMASSLLSHPSSSLSLVHTLLASAHTLYTHHLPFTLNMLIHAIEGSSIDSFQPSPTPPPSLSSHSKDIPSSPLHLKAALIALAKGDTSSLSPELLPALQTILTQQRSLAINALGIPSAALELPSMDSTQPAFVTESPSSLAYTLVNARLIEVHPESTATDDAMVGLAADLRLLGQQSTASYNAPFVCNALEHTALSLSNSSPTSSTSSPLSNSHFADAISTACLLAQSALHHKAQYITNSMAEHAADAEGFNQDGQALLKQPPALTDLDPRTIITTTTTTTSSYSTKDESLPPFSLVALIDPASTAAQTIAPLLLYARDRLGAHVSVILLAAESYGNDLPVKRFYRAALSPALSFATDGSRLPAPPVRFPNLQSPHLLTLGISTPEAWLVTLAEATYDMDNFRLSDVPSTDQSVTVRYSLSNVLFAGQCFDKSTDSAAAGLQLVVTPLVADTPSSASSPTSLTPPSSTSDTVVMENLGYFQLKANPGAYHFALADQHRALARLESVATQEIRAETPRIHTEELVARARLFTSGFPPNNVSSVVDDAFRTLQSGDTTIASAAPPVSGLNTTTSSLWSLAFEQMSRYALLHAHSISKVPYPKITPQSPAVDRSRSEAALYLPIVISSFAPRYATVYTRRHPSLEYVAVEQAEQLHSVYIQARRKLALSSSSSLSSSTASPTHWLTTLFSNNQDDTSKSLSSINADEKRARDTIHVFSIASGHLYERFLKIMMISVIRSTKSPVKFWFIENFLSPQFKKDAKIMASKLGCEVGFVSYKWPSWLRYQEEKQRLIWGYKILFLDVLFPLNVRRVIFVDADQVVRGDLKDLWTMPLSNGAPYAYTPFCSSNKATEGFRFWRQGYWKEHLRGRPYHISALYVVDLQRFRAMRAGDSLRMFYDRLSADKNSLANLDQDLPNYAQHMVPIHSLPQEWLWCETWCDMASLPRAKTIDLCNNPLTKAPKLDVARRLLPEWTKYDEEAAALTAS